MNTVMGNFRIYKAIEVILAIAGLLLTFFFRDQLLWYAFGVGLLAQAGIMLVLDLLAEQRGEVHRHAIKALGSRFYSNRINGKLALICITGTSV